jgi:hypothetical protein
MDWSDGGAAGVETEKVKTASSNRVEGIFISAILSVPVNLSKLFTFTTEQSRSYQCAIKLP